MFGNNRKRQGSVDIRTLVGAGTLVRGDIDFSGGCHVDGEVIGNLRATGPEPAVLSISESGRVEGSVQAPHIVLSGTVKGDVQAGERVELGATARVIGNVHYRLIEMAIGAEVNGKLVHEGAQPALPPPGGPEDGEILPAGPAARGD
jgi:cytoskeletal protein CcmA (bactofilin family)